jgi:nucleotide-binding universal stress UspA family protein
VAKLKVMVALRDADSVESLVALACQVSSGMDAELIALHVIELPMATPIEAHDDVLEGPGREILAHAQRFASQGSSREVATRLLRAHQIGKAIVGELQEQGIELLVMGYHQPHTLGEILLGSTVQYVARHAPCRAIVQIPPPHHR